MHTQLSIRSFDDTESIILEKSHVIDFMARAYAALPRALARLGQSGDINFNISLCMSFSNCTNTGFFNLRLITVVSVGQLLSKCNWGVKI